MSALRHVRFVGGGDEPAAEAGSRVSVISEARVALLRRMAAEWGERAAANPTSASVDADVAALALTATLDALVRALDAEDSAYANFLFVARERDRLLAERSTFLARITDAERLLRDGAAIIDDDRIDVSPQLQSRVDGWREDVERLLKGIPADVAPRDALRERGERSLITALEEHDWNALRVTAHALATHDAPRPNAVLGALYQFAVRMENARLTATARDHADVHDPFDADSPPAMTCDRCGSVYRIEYALTKTLWERFSGSCELLCLECLGDILRGDPRPLTLADFRFLSVGGHILIDAMPGEHHADVHEPEDVPPWVGRDDCATREQITAARELHYIDEIAALRERNEALMAVAECARHLAVFAKRDGIHAWVALDKALSINRIGADCDERSDTAKREDAAQRTKDSEEWTR